MEPVRENNNVLGQQLGVFHHEFRNFANFVHNQFGQINQRFDAVESSLAKRIDKTEEKVNILQDMLADEKAYNSLVIKNIDVLTNGARKKFETLCELEKLGVNTELLISDIWITKKAHPNSSFTSVTAIIETASPIKADKLRGQLIDILKKKAREGIQTYKMAGNRKIFVSVEGFIPPARREERIMLENKGKELKRSGAISAYRVCLVKSGAPLNPMFFLGLQTKKAKDEGFRPHHSQNYKDSNHRAQDPALGAQDPAHGGQGLTQGSQDHGQGAQDPPLGSQDPAQGGQDPAQVPQDDSQVSQDAHQAPQEAPQGEHAGLPRGQGEGNDPKNVCKSNGEGEQMTLENSPGGVSHGAEPGRSQRGKAGGNQSRPVRKMEDRSPQASYATAAKKRGK